MPRYTRGGRMIGGGTAPTAASRATRNKFKKSKAKTIAALSDRRTMRNERKAGTYSGGNQPV